MCISDSRIPGRSPRQVAYREITHCAGSRWGCAIATTGDIVLLRQSRFPSAEALTAAHEEVLRRIAGLPGGAAQLAQMKEIERRSGRLGLLGPVWLFAALCVVAQFFQFRDLAILHVGSFMPSLVVQGEAWRVVTANFLHDILIFPAHILLNLVCVVSFGAFVERALGAPRTVLVMGASAVGAMWASALADYSEVIGASGVAAGLVTTVQREMLFTKPCCPELQADIFVSFQCSLLGTAGLKVIDWNPDGPALVTAGTMWPVIEGPVSPEPLVDETVVKSGCHIKPGIHQ